MSAGITATAAPPAMRTVSISTVVARRLRRENRISPFMNPPQARGPVRADWTRPGPARVWCALLRKSLPPGPGCDRHLGPLGDRPGRPHDHLVGRGQPAGHLGLGPV